MQATIKVSPTDVIEVQVETGALFDVVMPDGQTFAVEMHDDCLELVNGDGVVVWRMATIEEQQRCQDMGPKVKK